MGQGWKRLPLLVVFLLFWKNTDGFKGGAYSNAHQQWGQPSDTFSPHAVQSSMPEARVTGTLPVEEVGSSLFSNKPLKSRSKFNLLQFVKGGSSSSQSTSHAQTAPGSSVSAFLPLPLDEQPLSSLTSAGSSISGAASGLSLQTLYAASGSGHLVSTQGGSSSYPAKLGFSDQSTSDGLHLSTSQETSVHKSAEASLPVFSQESISYSSSSAPGATSTSQSSPILSESSGQRVFSQGEGSYSALSQGASSPYTPGSLMSNKLDALPLGVSSQSTSAQSSPSGSPSTQSRSGTQLATSSRYVPVQGGSSSTSFSHKPQGTLGQYAPLSPTKYVSAPMSSPQDIYSQATSSGSSYRAVSQVGSLPQVGASDQFASRRGNHYSGLLPQSQATSSQGHIDYSSPFPHPKALPVSLRCLESRKQYASASQGSSRAQFGASTGFTSQGMSGSVPSQGTTSQFAPGSPSPYDSLYCKCALSPQGVDRESTTVQSSHKQFTSRYGTESGSSTPFTLQGSIAYDRSPRPQGTASQLGPVSHSYPSVSSSSQGVASQSTTVQFSRKQLASTYTGSSGTQAGSSPPFTLQEALLMVDHLKMPQVHLPLGWVLSSLHPAGSTAYGGSPQDAASPFAPGILYSLHPAGSTAYGGSPQDAASPLAPGYESSYGRVSLSSPQAGPSTTVQGSRKQFTSTFTGGSGTQAGSSPPFTLQGSTAYGGSPQDAASPFAPGYESSYGRVSLSSPQAVAGHGTVQDSQKPFTSTFTGGSGTQAGSSTPFTLQGSTAYGGSSQPQDAASQLVHGSYPYASVSLSSPQGAASQSSQSYQGASASQSRESQKWQPSATHLTPVIRTSDATASQGSSPMQFSSLSSAGGSSRVSGQFVSAHGGSTSYGGSFQSQSLSSKYTPGFQHLPYETSVAGQGTSSASEVLSSYSSMNNQNAPAQPSSSSRFYSVKG
ncbi:hypothetical protein G5714_010636 [Onychostoma macrolepis]|uniref:Mucin-19-like n=1 Tax=Onychostoma macrolepis TaxID=369639 RepID=A0A7J6CKN3_9TELE|nr:hypothetical protein G5714_010636 [Onychostoma macrolepis]